MSIATTPLARDGLEWSQKLVTACHYLKHPVDVRCSPLAYEVSLEPARSLSSQAGCLIFGRPEATRCGDWYGSVDDVARGFCEVTRWQVINLARVFIFGRYQGEGAIVHKDLLPGFTDRHGVWRSTLGSTAIAQALDRVVIDYLLARPPCFLDEPYELSYCLSYCDTRVHRGSLYKAAGFELYRTNTTGIQTWRKRLRPLTPAEHEAVRLASERSERSRKYRTERALSEWHRPTLFVPN